MQEKSVQKRVVGWLKKMSRDTNGEVWHMKVHGGQYQMAGVPDIMCVINGIPVFVELKATGKKPSAIQVNRIKELQVAGAIAFWSDDPDEITTTLNSIYEESKRMIS